MGPRIAFHVKSSSLCRTAQTSAYFFRYYRRPLFLIPYSPFPIPRSRFSNIRWKMLPLRANEKMAIGASGGSEFLSWEREFRGRHVLGSLTSFVSVFWVLTIVTRGFVTTQLSLEWFPLQIEKKGRKCPNYRENKNT